ncbi:MAG: hypothetical protein AAB897_02090 [Patescibacteria group bacterium]
MADCIDNPCPLFVAELTAFIKPCIQKLKAFFPWYFAYRGSCRPSVVPIFENTVGAMAEARSPAQPSRSVILCDV